MWGDWVEQYSSAKAAMYSAIYTGARASSAPTTPAVAASMLGYAGAIAGQGLNGGNCVGTFFFSYGWIWQACGHIRESAGTPERKSECASEYNPPVVHTLAFSLASLPGGAEQFAPLTPHRRRRRGLT